MSKTTFLPGVNPYDFKQAVTNLAAQYERTFPDKPNGPQDQPPTNKGDDPKPVKPISSLTDAEWFASGYGD